MEDALYEIESMRRFAGFSRISDTLPDETTILNFRHLLEKHELTPTADYEAETGKIWRQNAAEK